MSAPISLVDPSGALYYRGRALEDVIADSTFADVAILLADTNSTGMPKQQTMPITGQTMLSRLLPFAVTDSLGVIRTVVSGLGITGEVEAAALLGLLPIVVASCAQGRVVTLAGAEYSEALFLGLTGHAASSAESNALDAVLVCYADHGLCPSTSAAVSALEQGADRFAAIVAALAVFGGLHHGGEISAVLRWAEQGLFDRLALDRTPPGFGHATYLDRDPRAEVLLQVAERLVGATGRGRVTLDQFVGWSRAMKARFGRQPNVHFGGAVVLTLLGVPSFVAVGVAAAGRLAGWLAHTAPLKAPS